MKRVVLDGKVHCHIDFSDERNGFGGHLEGGTLALTLALEFPDDVAGLALLAPLIERVAEDSADA